MIFSFRTAEGYRPLLEVADFTSITHLSALLNFLYLFPSFSISSLIPCLIGDLHSEIISEMERAENIKRRKRNAGSCRGNIRFLVLIQ